MAQAQDEQIAAFRNFVVLGSLGLISLLVCAYITGLFLILILQQRNGIVRLFSLDFPSQIIYIGDLMIRSWKVIVSNFTKLKFSGGSYLIPKVVVGTFFPLSIYIYVIYKFREPIFDWRPFKVSESQYGNAHWATLAEIKKAGLLSKGTGMTMGMYKGKMLVVDKTNCQHALLFAPTGSGKGVGFVLPNLLFWDDSVIVHDVKLENFEITSGYRTSKMHQKCYLWIYPLL